MLPAHSVIGELLVLFSDFFRSSWPDVYSVMDDLITQEGQRTVIAFLTIEGTCPTEIFPHLKSILCGRRFETREELEEETRHILRSLPEDWYYKSMRKLESRWRKTVRLSGNYIEKLKDNPDVND